MNDHDLDLLLSDQDKIKADNFTANVMSKVPKNKSRKKEYILLGMLSLSGLISTFFIMSGDTFSELSNNFMNGDLSSQLITVTIALCSLAFFTFCFFAFKEDLEKL